MKIIIYIASALIIVIIYFVYIDKKNEYKYTYSYLEKKFIDHIIVSKCDGLNDYFKIGKDIDKSMKLFGKPDKYIKKYRNDIYIREYKYNSYGLTINCIKPGIAFEITIEFKNDTIDKILFYDGNRIRNIPNTKYIFRLYGKPDVIINNREGKIYVYNYSNCDYIFYDRNGEIYQMKIAERLPDGYRDVLKSMYN